MTTELPLYRVLEEEYETVHGTLPRMPPSPLLLAHLTDGPAWLRKLRTPADEVSRHLRARLPRDVRDQLDGEWPDDTPPPRLHRTVVDAIDALMRSEALYDAARFAHVTLSAPARALLGSAPSGEALVRLNRTLLSEAYPREIKPVDLSPTESATRLEWLYEQIHRRARSALCFSGGGIRSATFGLGVLQGLACRGLLDKFDYLSTVSGGGYLGSWVTAWIHRHPKGRSGVIEELDRPPVSPLEPAPAPVQHLRQYSNYLSPRFGVFSVDTWTLFATYGRNLFLNWLVLIPLAMAALVVPRIYVAILRWHDERPLDGLAWIALVLGGAGLVTTIGYMGLFRPSLEEYRRRSRLADQLAETRTRFLALCLGPLVAGAFLIATWWAWLNYNGEGVASLAAAAEGVLGPGLGDGAMVATLFFVGLGVLLHLAGWLVYSWLLRRWSGRELIVVVSTGLLAGLLASFAAMHVAGEPVLAYVQLYSCLGAPGILMILLLTVTVFVGLLSRLTSEEDREWLARLGGWVLLSMVAWSLGSLLVIFGPLLLTWLKSVVSVGALSSLLALAGGWSGKTGANKQENDQAGLVGVVLDRAAVLAAPVALAFIVILLSLATSIVLELLPTAETADHFQTILNSTVLQTLGLAVVLVAIGIGAGRFINVNRFSLHGMYRSRLIRAYLGASRLRRRPNPFTGFDPLDNLQMHELRPELLDVMSFERFADLVVALQRPASPLARALRGRLDDATRGMVDAHRGGPTVSVALEQALIDTLNELIVADGPLLAPSAVTAPPFSPALVEALAGNPGGAELVRLNRRLLEEGFPHTIRPAPPPPQRPFHVVNIALNLVSGGDLARQERRAGSFTVSHLHAGSWDLGYRRSREYGGEKKPFGISLGTAVTISGAAVSPNMGYHSSPVVTFLLAFFNVRLGWWLGNPGPAGEETFRLQSPRRLVPPLVSEALGMTDRDHPYVYLSDGGHFDNLGLYEMVLRRCRHVVVSDAGCDPECSLEDLGGAVRKIRIDFGVPIVLEGALQIHASAPGRPGKYCAIGRIQYSAVDGPGTDGWLVYIKPAVYGGEPVDVYNYAKANPTFPHETTANQFFTESQFESYRMLGDHELGTIWGRDTIPADLEDFIAGVERYLTENP